MSLTPLSNPPSSTEAFERNFRERWAIQTCEVGTQTTIVSPSPVLPHSVASKEVLVKFVCHLWVMRMPSHGLGELSETLQSMAEFYKEPPQRDQAWSVELQETKAKVTATIVRSEFHIDATE